MGWKIGFLFWVLSVFCIAPAIACRGPVPAFSESLEKSGTVFVGRIKSVGPVSMVDSRQEVEIVFEVERVWKGSTGKTISVFSDVHSCGFARSGHAGVGEKWLILASGQPKPRTGLLGGNVMLETARHQPTGQKIPRLLEETLGRGKIPAPRLS